MKPRGTIDFTRGINPCAPSGKAKQTLRRGIKGLAHTGPDPLEPLIRHLCRKEPLSPQNLLFGDGSTTILRDLIRILKPRSILVCAPLSTEYCALLEGFTGGLAEFPFSYGEDAGFDADGFRRAAREVDVAVIGNPHAVTGKGPRPEDVRRIVEETDGCGTVLVVDEAHREFSGTPSPVEEAMRSARTYIVRSFAPFHGFLGLPLGYLIGSPEAIGTLRSGWASRRFSGFVAQAAISSLRDKGFYRRTMAYLEEEKGFIVKHLSGTTGLSVDDTGGNVLLVGFPAGKMGMAPFCERRGILVSRFEDASGNEYVAFPIGKHRFNAALVRVLKRFAEEQHG